MPGYRRAYKTAKRLYPLVLMAYRRWDQMSEEEKARYREQMKRYSLQAYGYARLAAQKAPKRKRKPGD